MIQKKSFTNVIKRALQSGTFNYVGQQANQIPPELFKLDQLPLEGQNWWDCVPITKMDFSNNSITNIPEAITMFIDLQLFRMKNNQLKALPGCFNKFQTLKSLDLSKNKLTSIPNELASFFALVQLNLSENSIAELPNLHDVKSLEHLIVNDNKLKYLPFLGQGLRKIQASTNCIHQLTAATFKLCSKLQNLYLNKNGLQKIEKGTFSQTKNLIMIQLKENKLSSFSQVPQSDRLDTIALSYNRLTEFECFQKCPKLTVLILNDNKLKKLSPNIIKLKELKTLDISNNDLPNLPSELGFINSLVRLQVEGNPLTSIRQNVRMSGTNQLKSYLRDKMDPNQKQVLQKNILPQSSYTPHQQWSKLIQQFCINGELVLKAMKLDSLHSLVFQKDLRVLNVNDNKLTQISEEIANLRSLKAVYFNKNELSKLPNRIAALPLLESIQAQANKLVDFVPYQKPFFNSLHYLDLSTNKIAQIPLSILRITKLRTLLLSYNKLHSIEALWEEQSLHSLQILDVSSNQINDISDLVFCKQSLNYLNLQNNNLAKLPTVLGFMKLLGLKIDGNPLKLIKRQVIQKGTVAIMQFLRTRHSGEIPVRSNTKTVNHYVPEPEVNEQFFQPQIKKNLKEQAVMKPQINEPKVQTNQKEREALIASIEKQLKGLEFELQNGMGLNNWQKTEKKKKMQSLMIQRNKLLKQ